MGPSVFLALNRLGVVSLKNDFGVRKLSAGFRELLQRIRLRENLERIVFLMSVESGEQNTVGAEPVEFRSDFLLDNETAVGVFAHPVLGFFEQVELSHSAS